MCRRGNHSLARAILCIGLSLLSVTPSASDPRTTLDPHSANWQQAIGRLEVPITRTEEGRLRHFTEHCSAVAITPGPLPIFVSAWHCFDGYRSTLDPLQLVLPREEEPLLLTLIASGGSMRDDWALLRAQRPIFTASWIPISLNRPQSGSRVIAAGFAPTEHLPNSMTHRQLVADTACLVTDSESRPAASNCVARQGASGGAILTQTASGSARLLGIISAGDGKTVSFFYPTQSLLERVRRLR